MNLSAHFTLEEFIYSRTATRLKIDNRPPPAVLDRLKDTAYVLDLARIALGSVPILIDSGYRCPELNAADRGSKTSAHMSGLAADIRAPAWGSPLQVAQRLTSLGWFMGHIDQLIFECDSWVHIGLPKPGTDGRRQVMRYTPETGYTHSLIPLSLAA